MKKILMIISLLVVATGTMFAGQADLFSFDESAIEAEMQQLSALEDYVLANATSYGQLLADDNKLVEGLINPQSMPGMALANADLIIPAFLWGCLLGPIGIVIVAVLEGDKSDIRNSVFGCILGGCIWGGYGFSVSYSAGI